MGWCGAVTYSDHPYRTMPGRDCFLSRALCLKDQTVRAHPPCQAITLLTRCERVPHRVPINFGNTFDIAPNGGRDQRSFANDAQLRTLMNERRACCQNIHPG